MNDTDDVTTTIIFHVHLPLDTRSYKPAVLGNCEALGNWEQPKVLLHQIQDSNLWVSNPIQIPVNTDVEYKYCLVSSGIFSNPLLNFEGFGSEFNRRMEFRKNIYDIWEDSETFKKNKKNSTSNEDYAFVNYIYETIESPDNLSDGVMEYQYIIEKHRNLAEFNEILGFIEQHLTTNKTKEQMLFLCVLLGFYLDANAWLYIYGLPNNFPSDIMIKELKIIDGNYSILSDIKSLVVKAIKSLFQHNSKCGSLDWITLFALASKFDRTYSFIDSIESHDFEKQPNHFIKLLNEIKPIINGLKKSNSNGLDKMLCKLIEISYDVESLVSLRENFKDLKNNNFKNEIRKRLIELIREKKLYWNDKNVSVLLRLLKESNLGWQLREYANVLKAIAESNQRIVLITFPNILRFILGLNSKEIKSEIERESIKWFINICKECSTYDIFRYLSMMHSTSKHGREVLNKLLNRNIVTLLSDDSIFSITSNIGDFHEEIITHFISMVKERVRLVQVPDERLLEKIMRICNSTENLYIPNRFCEEILCFILGRLQDVKYSDIESFQLSLFQFAKFWMAMFKANGCTKKLHSHSYFNEVCRMIFHIATNIRNHTIAIRLLQKIFKYFINNNKFLKDYINSAIANYQGEYDVIITEEVIEQSYILCYEYHSTLERLQKFYEQFCPLRLVPNVKYYLVDLEKRSADATLTLRESYDKDHWSIHSMTIEIMKNYYHFVDSQTFYNVFQVVLDTELTVEVMNETFNEAIDNYKIVCEEYDNWEEIKCSEASEFWKNVDVEHVDKEINFMIPYVDKFKSYNNTGNNDKNVKKLINSVKHLVYNNGNNDKSVQKLINSVKLLVSISLTSERLRHLLIVIKALGVIPCDQDSWIEEQIDILENKELLLCQLHNIFDQLDKIENMSSLTNDIWSTIVEISLAIDFVIFLKSLVGHNLKNLINGVDDHSDERLIQENTVQTFIQVKQILEPLFEERNEDDYLSTIQVFLQILNDIIKNNPSLISKLRLCNANAQALINMYKNISNRGEMTKEKIFYSVTKGVFLFKRMDDNENRYTATLSYPSDIVRDGVARYTFADLQDLRGRALLIAKAPTNTNAKTLDDESFKACEITLDHMNEFVIRVDLAQKIIDTASSLKELGNFRYRVFKSATQSTQDMEKLLENLRNDLQNWKMIVNEAQKNHYYLTFFLAQHVLNFYDYFSCNKNIETTQSDIKEKCSILLRFVNDKLKFNLPTLESDILEIHLQPKNYYAILCKIGTTLHGIFSQIPITQRKMTAIVNHETVNVVRQGHLFIAKCDNKFRVPNVIMSLCNSHNKCYPAAWQLLICKSSTTEEELLTFTKRCFFAAKNGYGEHLFIIANVEFLNFELQYQLVSSIRSLCQQEKQFYLALICCLENSMHHHVLDQFPEYTHVIQGFDAVSMRNIYKELCPNVLVVSSDLSGLGKTKWIEEHSRTNGLIPRKFLISDGMTFGMLVQKLSEIKLKDNESLHLNIMLIDHHYDVNMFLFEFLTFKIVRDRTDFLNTISPPQIYIEIESTMNQNLLNSIPIIGHLENIHLTWNINNIIIPQNVNSPIQIVARYLDAYDLDTINKTDIDLNDAEKLISEDRCKQLLQEYFFDDITQDIRTYRFLEIFVNVLADQLKRMSSSEFFRVTTLKLMEAAINIRETLLETLIEVSMDFATRSVNSKKNQHENLSEENNEDISITAIKHWEDSNHLLVFFLSQSPDSICALYRDRNMVPKNVENLLASQHFPVRSNFVLDNYDNMSCEDILKKLECLARTTHEEREYAPYALSTDNLLKMALVLLRSRANVPVVICGEAGCGKTSLIQFLSEVVNVRFEILNLHAGITKERILEFISDAETAAEEGEIWLFFDEINTCNHIGILADLIAHRLLLGKEIHKNIRLFAACNPYRFRQKADTQAGLLVDRYEEKNSLVYQVRPLPDQILDYVWDYGVLKPSDEKVYINIMVKKSQKDLQNADLFTELLFASQEFVRTHEGVHSVSLRDVKRAIIIFKFFCKSIDERQKIAEKISEQNIRSKFLRMANDIKAYFGSGPSSIIKSYILALSLCYQARFFDQELRNQYQETMCEIFEEFDLEIDSKTFMEVVQGEQKDFMKRMTKPSMVAENFALLENVLAITVCILTRIPLFIIGAPGASKSLAIRLVSQSLRGNDSDDEYFRTLPQVYLVPHQGSSSSTSDGISTVFNKANNYQKGNSEEFPLITVVLLDEIGLAEKSPHNPLKVLHYLLEPNYPAELPGVSVIGISNWRLDNSKSSRALLVQRPNFDNNELIDTTRLLLGKGTESQFKALADSYLEYRSVQPINNFHGLRDYYFLVKSLSGGESAQMALARNFGGTNQMNELYRVHFDKVMTEFHGPIDDLTIDDLIKANLKDQNARHLMIIGKSDSIVNILTYKLKQWNQELVDANLDLEPVVIYGSQFPNDFNDDYQYSVLSRIMMCVEEGRPLILTDLDIIYGSLYDLWNQNYITVGKEGNQTFYTRVALGAYSNPMVCVHKNFRCILVLDEKKVNYSDPPLLNRFEKQKMTINDIIDDEMEGILNKLVEWSQQISTLLNTEDETASNFNENDIFIGFDKDETLQSLVIYNSNNPELEDENDILHKCKEMLLGIALPDGIIRSKKSMLSNDEIKYWYNLYFQQYHEDLPGYINSLLKDSKNAQGFNAIIYTFSNINVDIEFCLNNILKCQVDKLSTFKSEAQFQSRIKHFWLESNDDLLILQCDINSANSECIKLAKFIIEQYKNEFIANQYSEKQVKHVCMIIHLRKENAASMPSFNFLCGWDLFVNETLIPQEYPLLSYLDKSLINVLERVYTFDRVIDQELLWCLLRIEFPPSDEQANYIRSLDQKIPQHKEFMNWMKTKTFEWLHNNEFKDWQLEVALNKKDLYLYSSFLTALQKYICNQVRKPVAKLLFALEKLSGLLILDNDDLLHEENNQYDDDTSNLFSIWKPLIMDNKIVNIENIKMPYKIINKFHGLKLPFSTYYMEQINKFKNIYQDDLKTLESISDNLEETGCLKSHIIDDCVEKLSEHIISLVPALKIPQYKFPNAYFNDFVTAISHGKTVNSQILRRIISHYMSQEIPDPIRLHTFWWSNEDSILAESQLASLLPSVTEEILNTKFDKGRKLNLKDDLLKREPDIMIDRLYDIIYNSYNNANEDDKKLQLWQCDVANILTISSNLSNSFDNSSSLNVLQVYYDLSKSIPLAQILQIMHLETDLFSEQSIDIIFRMFDQTDETEINLFTKRSFIYRCLNTIPLEAPIRSYLYMKIFSQGPLPFTFHIIYLIFESENRAQEKLFFNLINNPEMLKRTKRLQVIENILANNKNSEIAALCCDVIQTQLTEYHFDKLSEYFLKAIDILISDSKELQKITAIALLKVFANELWNHTRLNERFLTNPIKFQFTNDNININDLNNHLRIVHPLIHSFKIYLLKSLYLKEFTTYEIKQFCDAQQQILPWVGVLKTDCDNRLGFNPYWSIEQFKQVDFLFKTISCSDELSVNNILNTIIRNNEITYKISLAGMIITKFYLIRASRKLNMNENILMQIISKYLQSSQLSKHYKVYLLNFMTNNHQLYKLSPNIKNTDVFISSVVAHVVALNISNPVNSSPLAAYMQALHDYKDTYILTCPSDELASITNAIITKDHGTRRYQCKCGNLYFIGDCGRPDELGVCNQCKNVIGGLDHSLNVGNSSIDNDKIRQRIAINDKQGYIFEDIVDSYHTVRTLHPASYRILRLFLHIIIGVQAHLPATIAFINNQSIDIVEHCKNHIENDWKALKTIFNCEDETLSLFIHSILSDMLQDSQKIVEKFTSSAQREAWEEDFNQRYILPKIKNFLGTTNNFRMTLDKNAENSLEINETMEVTDQYNENYLPLLWRLIKKPDLNDFRSYYMSNDKNKELFPLLNVFLEHEKYLNLIQHILPIVKFTQILSSSLSHNIERQKARQLTFRQFIENESRSDYTGKTKESLITAFNSFANSWNCLIPYVKRYRCKDLPQEMPRLHHQISVVYGLYVYEPTDESLYLSAVIEFLAQLQNNFLNDVIEISPKSCQSLKFIEKLYVQEPRYHLESIDLENANLEQIINYDDVDKIFLYCQYDLKLGHGQEIHYDLCKIEAELALKLVYGKKLIKINKDQMYLNAFMYNKELFSRSMTILEEIKNLIHQEPIPANNKFAISENQMDLLSVLEIIICFLKQTSGGDRNSLISDYIEKWMKLSVMKRNNSSYELLANTGLQLKHIVALYELVEEHVADIVVNCISFKYQAELNEYIKQDIMKSIDFKEKPTEIPAKAFLTALKRLIIRYLSTDSEIIKENAPLSLYLVDIDSLGCWPDYVSKDVIEAKFPTTLSTSHIYNAYKFVKERKHAIDQEIQITINNHSE
ncbi:hypothetical protein C2G38_2175948 [Gigaspora rosea]|uniref:Uncharacterized protein n=1 Tax=Gigaspora rosea TaxID=44941 RepID=A0A397VRB2_9GLOM|nr:hypothetical protein C2G38_2175948 [Gigaspora rosea]